MLGPIAPISDAARGHSGPQAQSFRHWATRFDYGCWCALPDPPPSRLGFWRERLADWRGWTGGSDVEQRHAAGSGGSAAALLLPNWPLARCFGHQLPRDDAARRRPAAAHIPVYRRLLVAATLLEGSHAAPRPPSR